jgi:hypothetical protein
MWWGTAYDDVAGRSGALAIENGVSACNKGPGTGEYPSRAEGYQLCQVPQHLLIRLRGSRDDLWRALIGLKHRGIAGVK